MYSVSFYFLVLLARPFFPFQQPCDFLLLSPSLTLWGHLCDHVFETIYWSLLGTLVARELKRKLPSLRTSQQSSSQGRVEPWEFSTHLNRLLAGPLLCRSIVGKKRVCEFKITVAMPYQKIAFGGLLFQPLAPYIFYALSYAMFLEPERSYQKCLNC